MQKQLLLLITFIICTAGILPAQTHNAVSLDNTKIYTFLEMAELKGLTSHLPAAKPYPLSFVVSQLERIDRVKTRLTPEEQEVFNELYDQYAVDKDQELLKDGDLRFEDENFRTRLEATALMETHLYANEAADSSAEASGTVKASGDLGSHVSWDAALTAGAYKVDDYDTSSSYGPESYEPYTYTKTFDGGVHPLSSLNNYEVLPTSLSVGTAYETEIAASFWDNRADFRFGRLRREWGAPGEGSLFLDAGAMPFMAYEGTVKPLDWVTFSFLTGTLDYGETFRNTEGYSIKDTAETQQNMYSVLQIELMPTDWLYLSAFDGGVYMKRTELGYANPLMSRFLNQNSVGDFDNLAMGGTLVLKKAGLGKFYSSVFLDEAKFNKPDFFGNYGNMYSIQAGVKAPVPGMPLTSATLQYTKIEPFTYTHYTVDDSPWYSGLYMETGYMNGGESLGYGLEPNSDELMLRMKSLPRKGLSFEGGYRMIRHGKDAGSSYDSWGGNEDTNVEGEEEDWIDENSDENGAYNRDESKDFLKDGIYEWYHIGSIGGEWDLSSRGQPVSFGMSYSLVFKYYTDYESSGDFSPMDSAGYENEFRHLVSFAVRIYP